MAIGRNSKTVPVSTLTATFDKLRTKAEAEEQAAEDFIAAATAATAKSRIATNQAIAVEKAYQILSDAGVTSL